MVRTHLDQPRFAIFAIQECDDCQHDRTPLLISNSKIERDSFQAKVASREKRLRDARKMVSSHAQQ
jgi:hypothetical protein